MAEAITTTHRLTILEGIKATAWYNQERLSSIEDEEKHLVISRKRNELIDAWSTISISSSDPTLVERVKDTARVLSTLATSLDCPGGPSFSEQARIQAASLASLVPSISRFIGSDFIVPQKKEPLAPDPKGEARKNYFSWIFESETLDSSTELTITELEKPPTLDLTPKEDLADLYSSIYTYWENLKISASKNVSTLLKAKVVVTVNKDVRRQGLYHALLENSNRFLISLRQFELILKDSINLFGESYDSWLAVSNMPALGREMTEIGKQKAEAHLRYLSKLRSIRSRLTPLISLIDGRLRRYNEELNKP